MTGSIISFNEERGFGFIQPDKGEKWRRYFCHITKFMNLLDGYPQPGQRVSFELATTPRGEAAVDIQIII